MTIPSWNTRPFLGDKCFKNPRGLSAALASIRAPPLRDAFQSRVLHTNSIFRKRAFLLCTWSRHGWRSRPVWNRQRVFFRAPHLYTYIFFIGICGPRIGRGATCSRGVLCARPRGLVRAYPTKFLPWFPDCPANVLPGLSNQPAALPRTRRNFDANCGVSRFGVGSGYKPPNPPETFKSFRLVSWRKYALSSYSVFAAPPQ